MIWALVIIIILMVIFMGRDSSPTIPDFVLNDAIDCRINALSAQIEEVKEMLIDLNYEMKKEKEGEY